MNVSDPLDSAGTREVWPLLVVSDLEASLRHYVERLGFETVGQAVDEDGAYWCRLRRGGASLMLQRGAGAVRPPGSNVQLYFICDDVDALATEVRSRGVDLGAPVDAPYGMRQLRLPDPDGYEIWFETRTGDWRG